MKSSKDMPRWLFHTLQVLSFIFTVLLVYILMPHTGRVDRFFEIGKPWAYDVLIAPIDFPIYKTDQRLESDRDSALKALVPYYIYDGAVADKQIEAFVTCNAELDGRTSAMVVDLLRQVYGNGVLPIDQMMQLQEWRTTVVEIVDSSKIAHSSAVGDLYTQKLAYDFITGSLQSQSWVDIEQVRLLGLDKYIKPNLMIDKSKTDHAVREIVDGVMLTSGMVQRGERIIDRGEVVTPRTYQILISLQRMADGSLSMSDTDHWNVVGDILLVVILYILLFVYFYMFRSGVLSSLKSVLFMLLMSVGMISLLSLTVRHQLNEYLVPFAMLPLVVRVFFDSRTALYIHLVTVLVASQMVQNPMEFILLQILAGMVAVSSLKDFNSRAQLARSAALVFLVYVVSFTAIELSRGIKPVDVEWEMYFIFLINTVAMMFAYLVIFIIEKLFGFLSSMTLVELSNINSPLLMEFSEKCPGTFQHVLQVSNLSVEVAKRVDADALLVRTGALYHDLGKMANPMLFTENQFSGINPLSTMPYQEAAQIIIRHVSDGISLAERARLPRQIINFIASHHGTSKTRYFYNSFKNEFPNEPVDEAMFTYPGPLPASKEEAILMMTDAIEAASRSLKAYDTEVIDKMVENVIDGQIADGQFKNAPLSFRDVEVAKSVFKDKLKNIYHTRISYPKLNAEEKKDPTTLLAEMPIIKKIRKTGKKR